MPVLAAAEGGPIEILGADPLDVGGGQSAEVASVGGWLVPPRNPALLAVTLRRVLSLSREELRQIGQLGRLRAEDHFSARAFARNVARVFASLNP